VSGTGAASARRVENHPVMTHHEVVLGGLVTSTPLGREARGRLRPMLAAPSWSGSCARSRPCAPSSNPRASLVRSREP